MAQIIPTGRQISGASTGVNVCLYDYGFVDFQENGVVTKDLQADLLTHIPKSDVISITKMLWALCPEMNMVNVAKVDLCLTIHMATLKWGPLMNREPCRTITVAPNGSLCHLHTTYTSMMKMTCPAISLPMAILLSRSLRRSQLEWRATHLFLIDVDFGHDLSALMSSTTGSVIDDIYESFLEAESYNGVHCSLPNIRDAASFGGPKGPVLQGMKFNLPSSRVRFSRPQQMQTKAVTIGQRIQITNM